MINNESIIEYLLSKITKEWKDVKLPLGRKSNMDLTEEELQFVRNNVSGSWEESRIEYYFQDKSWEEVEPYNKITRYIPLPMHYMNDAAALYYSQCYLRYFVRHVFEIKFCNFGFVDLSFSYFREYDDFLDLSEGDFHKLTNVTSGQIEVVEEVTNFILPFVNLGNILIGSNKKIDSIETINTSYKRITALHKKIIVIEEMKTSESAEPQINFYKRIIGSYESIIASYENIFTTKKKWKHMLNEIFSWFKK